eukprot:CAMPEP_0174328200 /NCGR_PEP_ID=MMETSP0810-20121108/14982_1 /TAXON_ID=73025 ORGANISM="Eutreptiella gymnastica-like, Strain CCMP1594" /NCGR_SAMPLE_ID=MMETSP0810 /ASSEMBLY_ACC=CAM_ASM_000659 /LENGTH=203 /DNA_ID=CAMNT_0015442215 /DNA_START=131 /DNA_END=742 /DNA_ORIENTATION=-
MFPPMMIPLNINDDTPSTKLQPAAPSSTRLVHVSVLWSLPPFLRILPRTPRPMQCLMLNPCNPRALSLRLHPLKHQALALTRSHGPSNRITPATSAPLATEVWGWRGQGLSSSVDTGLPTRLTAGFRGSSGVTFSGFLGLVGRDVQGRPPREVILTDARASASGQPMHLPLHGDASFRAGSGQEVVRLSALARQECRNVRVSG